MFKMVTGRFGPESFRPWVVSAQFDGSFRPIFLNYQDVTEGQLYTFLASWRVHGLW